MCVVGIFVNFLKLHNGRELVIWIIGMLQVQIVSELFSDKRRRFNECWLPYGSYIHPSSAVFLVDKVPERRNSHYSYYAKLLTNK